jgi:pyridoxal 5'-phosphate synthase pdxT subunit
MRVGVLALQGGFLEHGQCLEALGHLPVWVRKSSDLNDLNALILPGGESTAMMTLLKRDGLYDILRSKLLAGLPVWGTCAGAILLGQGRINDDNDALSIIPVRLRRNAYGSQQASFHARLVQRVMPDVVWRGVFIRAPQILDFDDSVEPIVWLEQDKTVVAVRQEQAFLSTFHPELTQSCDFHRYFLNEARQHSLQSHNRVA